MTTLIATEKRNSSAIHIITAGQEESEHQNCNEQKLNEEQQLIDKNELQRYPNNFFRAKHSKSSPSIYLRNFMSATSTNLVTNNPVKIIKQLIRNLHHNIETTVNHNRSKTNQ
jgi:hypothetical protein